MNKNKKSKFFSVLIVIAITLSMLISGCDCSFTPAIDVSKLPPVAGHYYHEYESNPDTGEEGYKEWIIVFDDGTGVYATPNILEFKWDYNYMYFDKSKITKYNLEGSTLTLEYDGAMQIFLKTHDNPEDEYLLNLIKEKESK